MITSFILILDVVWWSGRPWLGPGLVQVQCASLSLFRLFFRIARTRETLWYLIYPSPRRSSSCQLFVET